MLESRTRSTNGLSPSNSLARATSTTRLLFFFIQASPSDIYHLSGIINLTTLTQRSTPLVSSGVTTKQPHLEGQNLKKSSQLISGGSEESIYKTRLKKVMNLSILSRSVFSKYFHHSSTDLSLTLGSSFLYRRLLCTRMVARAMPTTCLSRPITSCD